MTFMQRYLFMAVVLLVNFPGCRSAIAQVVEPQQQGIPTVTITGKLAGPPLWKITRGQHTLWIFADIPVVPEDLDWDSSRVDQILSESEVFLTVPRTKAGGITAMFTARGRKLGELIGGLRRLGPDRTLDEVIDAGLYQRLSESVPPDSLRELSQYKPWFAGRRLMDFWIRREGFTENGYLKVDRKLERLRRKHGVRKVRTELDVPLGEFEQHLQQQLSLPDDLGTACLQAALDFSGNAEALRTTLASWFAGELPLSPALQPLRACDDDNPLNGQSEQRNFQLQRAFQLWVDNLEKALVNHEVSFALVPIGMLLDDNNTAFSQWLERNDLETRRADYDN